jgi:integrase
MATVRQYRGRYVADFRDQNGRRRIEVPTGPFETKALEKRAANELLQRRIKEIAANTYTPSRERLMFSELADRFLASNVQARKTTLDGYGELIDCYLRPYFGDRKVESITRLAVEEFRAEMAKGAPDSVRRVREAQAEAARALDPPERVRPLRPGARTTNKCLTLLTGIFRYAVEHNLANRNVAAGMDKLKTAEGESRVIEQNVLTPPELRRIIEAAVPPYQMPITIAAHTGCRQAEVLGLKWGDIDWSRRTAEIRRTWRRGNFYEPKTRASRRTIELPDDLVAALRRWRLACPKGEHDLVCPAAGGEPMQSSDLLRSGFQPALRRAGVRQVRFHDLRHAVASNLLAAGFDVVSVARALGHANAHITLTVYSHAIPKERQGTADAMSRLIREQSGNKMETLAAESQIKVGQNSTQVYDDAENGEVAERLNAPVLKTGKGASLS